MSDQEKNKANETRNLNEEATAPSPSYVSLVQDPYGLTNPPEIAEAQDSQNELDLDLDLEQDLEALSGLSKTIAEMTAAEPAEETEEAEDPEALLAAQIAEDQKLEEELARERREEAAAAKLDPELAAALPKPPQADESGNLDLAEMESCLEALLFMCDKPVSLNRLRDLLGPDFAVSVFQEALTSLKDRYRQPRFGIELVEVAGGYQLRTKPGRAALAMKLAKVQTQRLSSGAMESLAIIAYRQPVMKEDVDKIRGVDSSYFIRGLLDKKLIRITGRSELPGRPMLYGTTDEFLELFGLKDLAAMPSLREVEQMIPSSESASSSKDEDPRVKELRRLVGQMNAAGTSGLGYDPREDEKILGEIRERVQSIPTSTPYLEEQKALEKAAQANLADTLAAEMVAASVEAAGIPELTPEPQPAV